MENLEYLKERLAKAYEKKQKIEDEIKRLNAKIEQAEVSNIKAALKEYNISVSDLPELLKALSEGNTGALECYEVEQD